MTVGAAHGSRTAGYLVAGGLASVPTWMVLDLYTGVLLATSATMTAAIIGLVWLAKRRQEDPGWDRRPPT